MNPLLKKQLEKLPFLNGKWNETTRKLFINKGEVGQKGLQEGVCYLIQVEEYNLLMDLIYTTIGIKEHNLIIYS